LEEKLILPEEIGGMIFVHFQKSSMKKPLKNIRYATSHCTQSLQKAGMMS
jgi:hypothetical protein